MYTEEEQPMIAESTFADLLIGSFALGADPNERLSLSGTAGRCRVSFDLERKQWRADCYPLIDQPPIQAWADRQHAAILAVFAKWLCCEQELRDALVEVEP